MGAGYTCMNDLVVMQTAQVRENEDCKKQGISEYLLSIFGDSVKERGVVVG